MKQFHSTAMKQVLEDGIVIATAALLFSAGIAMFVKPAKLIMGGVTGIATAASLFAEQFGIRLPIGILTLLLNIPLLIAVWIRYGFRFIGKTLLCTVTVSLATDYLPIWPKPQSDPLISAVFGGVIIGAALGILFARGYNTGGTDLVVFLIRAKHKRLSAGKIVLLTDCIIVLLSAAAMQSAEMVFYSAVTIYVQSKTIDAIVNGFNSARAAFIVTDRAEEVAKALTNELERGVTLWNGCGYYTGNDKKVLLCAISPKQVHELKSLVLRVDSAAFVIITAASEISGYGFEKRGI